VLNLALTKFTSIGEITTNFLLNDVKVWLMNTTVTGNYASKDWALLGFTSAEKTINPINEKYEREDKIPRVTTYVKTIRKGLEVKCALSNQSAQLDSVINQGTFLSLGATGSQVSIGTSEPEMQYRAIRFSADLDDGTIWTLTIPKCEMRQDGEKTLGGESETVTPLLLKAIYNPRASSETVNLYYMQYLAKTQSATADVPDGY
jgi:hypothetical protein